MVGGSDGTAPTATVWRAQVLDPLATPEVVDLGVTLLDDDDPRAGLAPGLWIYRVAAVFAADDAVDPGGESLPGEPLVVQLPDVAGLELTLTWDAIPEAVGYRVYRTPAPDMGVDEVELLATVTGERVVLDAGDVDTDPLATPLAPGSLGQWAAAGTLGVPREAPAVAVATSPVDSAVQYLYAFGGARRRRRSRAGSTPASPSRRPRVRRIASTRASRPSPPAAAPSAPRAPRRRLHGAGRRRRGRHPAGRTWIYVGPGRTAGSTTDAIDAGLVLSDGRLGTLVGASETPGLVAPAKRPSGAAGYGVGVANGFLFTFGGAGGAASKGGISGEMCLGLGVGGCNPDRLPEVRNWNSLGVDMTVSRVWMGSVQESAFFFIAGGFDGVAVTRRVDTTVQ
ncbi:MAG: hypothetical protein U1F43_05050 [Myxococcota bacterium]